MIEILDLIKRSLEVGNGLAVLDISTSDGVAYEVDYIGPKGPAKTKVALLIVELREQHANS